jgi:hypothetical protein
VKSIIHNLFFWPALIIGCISAWIELKLHLNNLGPLTTILRHTLFLPATLLAWLSVGIDCILDIEEED